jgi:hypothetical protein
MVRLLALALSFAAALSAPAQDRKDPAADKIGKDKAPNVAKKMIIETQKKKLASISMTGEMASGPGAAQKITGAFEGVLRKDFAGVKGTLEIYAQGTKTLVNTGARFDLPEEIDAPQQAQAATFRNPALLINEVSRLVNVGQFLGEETIDGKECKELTFLADEATVKQYLKEIGERLNRQFKNLAGGAGALGSMINFASALDEKSTVGSYSVMAGRDDLLIRKITFVIKPKINPKSLPPQLPPQVAQMNLDQRYEVKFSKWDEDVAFEIPAAIKAKWGIK